MSKKVLVKVVLNLEFDLQEEHSYQLLTRIENNIHAHVNMGMFSADHASDACLSDIKINIEEVNE